MQEKLNKIATFYNATAAEYAKAFFNELSHKPFDRSLLQRFVLENKSKGRIGDLGCGPGQTTKFLSELGVTDLVGIDLSAKMIEQAKALSPTLEFETGNMLGLDKPDCYFGGLIAFYAIVHFDYDEVKQFLTEARRVLKNTGQLLFSFHTGDQILTVDEFLGKKASADFHFHEPGKICATIDEIGFKTIDVITRFPYKDKEYPSKRSYIIIEK